MPLETAPSLSVLAERAAHAFAARFGRPPTVVAAAPGRVNLIGEHTDYNDGFVLPMAIDRYTVVAADPVEGSNVRLASATMESVATLSPEGQSDGEQPSWAKYVRGVLSVYHEEGLATPPFEAVIDSTVPLGSGLSSSAALEVSLATAIEALAGHSVDPKRRALLCQQAEHRAGVPCGIMDQFSSALCLADHLMLLDCRTQEAENRPFTDRRVTALITNSNVEHALVGGEYAERRAQCEQAAKALGISSLRDLSPEQFASSNLEGILRQRARHVIDEIDRTSRAAEAVASGRWPEMGELMYASHASLRDDYEVSCAELDLLVKAAQEVGPEGGVIGSRMTGGGFGGCTISLVRTEAAEQVADRITAHYVRETGITPTQFVTRPMQGAQLLELG